MTISVESSADAPATYPGPWEDAQHHLPDGPHQKIGHHTGGSVGEQQRGPCSREP